MKTRHLKAVGVAVAVFLVSHAVFNITFSMYSEYLLKKSHHITKLQIESSLSQSKVQTMMDLAKLYERRLQETNPENEHSKPVFEQGKTCLSNAPHRAIRSRDPVDNLPLLVFVAGIEGAGHEILDSVWDALQQGNVKLDFVLPEENFHNMNLTQNIVYRFANIDVLDLFNRLRERMFEPYQNNAIIVDNGSSFPLGGEGGSLNHPDLLHLLLLDGVLFDLRVIMLYRNPVDAIHAAVLKDIALPFKTLQYQSRVTEETLAYLNNAMLLVPCEQQLWIDYDCFANDGQQYANALAAFLDVPQDVFAGLRAPTPTAGATWRDRFPAPDTELVEEFIASHADIWPHYAMRPACTHKPAPAPREEILARKTG